MKHVRNLVLCLASVILPHSLQAQQPASIEPAPFSISPPSSPTDTGLFQPPTPVVSKSPRSADTQNPDSQPVDPLPLIPQTSKDPHAQSAPLGDLPDFDLTTRKPNAPVPDGPNRTEEAALKLAQRIRFREIKARVLTSPDVQRTLEASRSAHTDRELRAFLKTHYELLFSKMASLDASLLPLIQEQKTRVLGDLAQTIGPEKR